MMNLNANEKRIIFHILFHIMKADLVTREEEIRFLDQIFKDFKLSIDEFDHMDELDIDYLFKEYISFNDETKVYAHNLFLEMAKCDGYVDSRELEIIELLSNNIKSSRIK